jgi:triosephosphate isomerase
MSVQRKKIVAGNWKMNGTLSSLEHIRQLRDLIKNDTCEVIVCPPTTLLSQAIDIVKNSAISIGSQNCHEKNSGAYTGEVSPEMLVDLGVQVVILGHSERRENNFETSKLVQNKAKVSHKLRLTTIICIGETEAQKK